METKTWSLWINRLVDLKKSQTFLIGDRRPKSPSIIAPQKGFPIGHAPNYQTTIISGAL
jgi:hypothetical protein